MSLDHAADGPNHDRRHKAFTWRYKPGMRPVLMHWPGSNGPVRIPAGTFLQHRFYQSSIFLITRHLTEL
jgi:hypothetical protein